MGTEKIKRSEMESNCPGSEGREVPGVHPELLLTAPHTHPREAETWRFGGTGRVEPPAAKSKETLRQWSPGLLALDRVKAPSSHCPGAQLPAAAKALCLVFENRVEWVMES